MTMAESKPFKINISDADLDILRQKLELARLPDSPEGYTVKQGVTVPEMARVVEYWKTDFLPNWRKHEAKLNEFPMFTRPVKTDGFGELEMHFIHKRSEREDAIPLLFVHGWPGSFIEASKLIEPLTNPPEGKQAFHIVAPSLPNYGFSEGVHQVRYMKVYICKVRSPVLTLRRSEASTFDTMALSSINSWLILATTNTSRKEVIGAQ